MSLWVTKCLLLKNLTILPKNMQREKIEIKAEPLSDSIYYESQGDKLYEDRSLRLFLSSEKLCRLCESPANVSVFKKIDEIDISSIILIVTNIAVKKDDWYPKYICSICLEQLRAAFMFKIKCQQTDMKYKQLIATDTTTSGINRHDFTLLLQKMSKGIKIFRKSDRKSNVNKKHREISPISDSPQNPSSFDPPESPATSLRCLTPPTIEVQPLSPQPLQAQEQTVLKIKKRKKKHVDKAKKVEKKVKIKDKSSGCKSDRTCIKCDATFSDDEKIRSHRDQNACKRVQCPQCSKLVLNLRIHTRRMHPTGEVFHCDHCSKAYPIMSMLQRHMLVHTEIYDFPCNQCSYRGKRKEYLKIHMRTHGAERYLCSECPATFINQSNFNKHRIIHTNKKYQCDKCKKSFRYAKQLRCHDEAQHQKIRHPCAMCGQVFKYRTKLLKHELKIHNREKRKLNKFSASVQTEQLEANKPVSQVDISVDNVPIETYLHFKKDGVNDTFYST